MLRAEQPEEETRGHGTTRGQWRIYQYTRHDMHINLEVVFFGRE